MNTYNEDGDNAGDYDDDDCDGDQVMRKIICICDRLSVRSADSIEFSFKQLPLRLNLLVQTSSRSLPCCAHECLKVVFFAIFC